MKRWFVTIIIGTFGRFFNNPNLVYKLEDRLANSGVVRQIARTLVGLYQRGAWELRQIKSSAPPQLKAESFDDVQKELLKKYKQFESDLKKRINEKK